MPLEAKAGACEANQSVPCLWVHLIEPRAGVKARPVNRDFSHDLAKVTPFGP